MKFTQTYAGLGPWKLPKNEIWNIPENPKVHFKIEHEGEFLVIEKMRLQND